MITSLAERYRQADDEGEQLFYKLADMVADNEGGSLNRIKETFRQYGEKLRLQFFEEIKYKVREIEHDI